MRVSSWYSLRDTHWAVDTPPFWHQELLVDNRLSLLVFGKFTIGVKLQKHSKTRNACPHAAILRVTKYFVTRNIAATNGFSNLPRNLRWPRLSSSPTQSFQIAKLMIYYSCLSAAGYCTICSQCCGCYWWCCQRRTIRSFQSHLCPLRFHGFLCFRRKVRHDTSCRAFLRYVKILIFLQSEQWITAKIPRHTGISDSILRLNIPNAMLLSWFVQCDWSSENQVRLAMSACSRTLGEVGVGHVCHEMDN